MFISLVGFVGIVISLVGAIMALLIGIIVYVAAGKRLLAAEKAARGAPELKPTVTEQGPPAVHEHETSAAKKTGPDELTQLRQKVEEQESLTAFALAETGRLRGELKRHEAVVAGRDATIADLRAQLERAKVICDEPEGQFRKLRALILKELHPDHAPADSVDRAIRSEVFKVIWPKIEAIAGG